MIINPLTSIQMPSLVDWLEKLGETGLMEELRREDYTKFDRLKILGKNAEIPVMQPKAITIEDIVNRTPNLQETIKREGNNQCAIRLIPLDNSGHKLRIRNISLSEFIYRWLPVQNIDLTQYKLEVVPQNTSIAQSAIFLVNDKGILGTMIDGVHWQLTQGLYEQTPMTFFYNFNRWFYSTEKRTPSLYKHIELVRKATELIRFKDRQSVQDKLKAELGSEFTADNYLKGYFEVIVQPDDKMFVNDYDRYVYKLLKNLRVHISERDASLFGTPVSSGKIQGRIKIIRNPQEDTFISGDILVCEAPTIEYAPLIKRALAIIAERGNILSHFATVSRELGKPCIVEVKNITQILKDGDKVIVDGDEGVIYTI